LSGRSNRSCYAEYSEDASDAGQSHLRHKTSFSDVCGS
jgi:hypothetical protein